MQFQNPWGALAFLLIPLLILLYLLKQRYREETVPSTFLWRKVASEWEASHPWQKWRKNLLFFLQLIVLCLLILALMRPVLRTEGMGSNSVVVVDVSLSMQAREDGETRLERAKEAITQMIDRMQPGEQMSIVLAGHQNELLVVKGTEKAALRHALSAVQAENGSNTLQDALQLAKSLQEEEAQEVIYLFTDQDMPQLDEQVVQYNVALGAPNLTMASVRYARNTSDDTISVLGLVQNYAGAELATVELWCDGVLTDVRDVPFGEEPQANVIFEGVSPAVRRIKLAISQEDALMADNEAFCVVQENKAYRILLLTERNVFLEKAVLLREDIELYKGSLTDELPLETYDLIIGDGWVPETLPPDQPVWLIGPTAENDWLTVEEAKVAQVSVANTALAETLFAHVDLSEASFAKLQGLTAKEGQALPMLYCGETVLVLAQGDGEGTKRLAFGFDFHDSNLPMKKDFPILVQNVLAWFLPLREGQINQILADEALSVPLSRDAVSYSVTLPDEGTLTGQTQLQFSETGQLGFYGVTQEDAAGDVVATTAFSVNPGLGGGMESNLHTAPRGEGTETEADQSPWSRSTQVLPYLVALVLLIMLLEWWVYHRGS